VTNEITSALIGATLLITFPIVLSPEANASRSTTVPPSSSNRFANASETLRKYVRQVEANEGRRKDVLSSQEREEIKALRREVAQLRRANEILKAASVFFAGELDPHRPR